MRGISSRATKGKVTKMVARTIPGTAKMSLTLWASSQGPSHPWRPKGKDVDKPRDHRGYGKREVDKGDEDAFSGKIEFRDRPGGGHAEDEVERNAHRRRHQREPDGGKGVCLAKRRKVSLRPFFQGLGKYGGERHEEEYGEECKRRPDEEPTDMRRFGEAAAGGVISAFFCSG
jgi:hypothetical protein